MTKEGAMVTNIHREPRNEYNEVSIDVQGQVSRFIEGRTSGENKLMSKRLLTGTTNQKLIWKNFSKLDLTKVAENVENIFPLVLFICLMVFQLFMGYSKSKFDSFIDVWLSS